MYGTLFHPIIFERLIFGVDSQPLTLQKTSLLICVVGHKEKKKEKRDIKATFAWVRTVFRISLLTFVVINNEIYNR